MDKSLKKKAIKGIAWNFIEQFGIQGIRFILGIILARLLMPKDFGLIAIVTVIFTLAEVFIQSGFGQAYIQKKEVTNVDANTIFYYNLATSIIFYIVIFFSAPFISEFYREAQLINLVRVIGFVLIINSFNVIQIAQVTRDINFKRKTKITLISISISGFIGISSATYGLGVWALVIQLITNRLITTIGFWVTSNWMPGRHVSMKAFKEMFSFGFWILLSSLLKAVFDNIYILTIGKFFPVAQVGYYQKSDQFQKLASNNIISSINSVSFPIFSKLQDDKDKLRSSMRKFLQLNLILIIPILISLLVVAKPFVLILLTEKWAPMIPYLQLLCVVGIIYPFRTINYQVLLAIGKSKLSFKLTVITNVFRIINIIVMYRFSITYIILGEIILSGISYFLNSWFLHRLISYGFKRQLLDVWKILFSALVAGIISAGLLFLLSNVSLKLSLGIVSFFLFFIITLYLISKDFLLESFLLLKKYIIK